MKACVKEGCEKPAPYGRLCPMHRARLVRHGSLDDTGTTHAPADVRFWRYVDKTSTCWLWQGFKNNHGYGQFWDGSRKVYAHRYALQQALGRPLEQDEVTRHLCDTPACVRSSHLTVGRQADNVHDMMSRGRNGQPKGEEHPRARLTDVDVAEIRKRVSGGVSRRQLATEFGVSYDYLCCLATGARR